MAYLRINELRNSSILRIYSERDQVFIDPDYQRMSGVWNLEKRQLLIDTIINDFDMPKLYVHEFPELKELEDGRKIKYAVIDGKQRLETIWSFIEGQFALSDDFEFYEDTNTKAGGMTYLDLSNRYPELKTRFDSHTLPIVTIGTDDLELIEELFLRLNEAVPLNAAEKRNAMGGPLPRVISELANHRFFKRNVPFSNKRYQHREVGAKFLLLAQATNIGDTKKAYLDHLVHQYRNVGRDKEAVALGSAVGETLDSMHQVFIDKDPLLKTQAMTVIYYLVFMSALENGVVNQITREKLNQFESNRVENREVAEKEIADADYELLEFDRMSLQGSNDRVSIQFRLDVLMNYLFPNR